MICSDTYCCIILCNKEACYDTLTHALRVDKYISIKLLYILYNNTLLIDYYY